MKLRNKVAIVTGGSQGIGKAIALRYGQEGAKVAVVNTHNPKLGQAVARRIVAAGGKARAYACDVSKRDQVQSLVKNVVKDFGRVDILLNGAGVMINKPIEDYTEADWDKMLGINLKGTFLMCQAVVPLMKKQKRGKIVNIASIAATHAFPNALPYCASKGGVYMITRALAAEIAKCGINVNSISPGNTATPLNEHLQRNPKFVKLMASYTPTGRAYITTQEMAGAAVFLASDDASAVHGHDLVVDDGWCAI